MERPERPERTREPREGPERRQAPAPAGMIFLCTCVSPDRVAAAASSSQPSPPASRLADPLPARCSNETLAENLERRVSGLTRGSLRDVEALPSGSPIFLFNVNDKRLHGVFESVRRRRAAAAAGRRRWGESKRAAGP